MHPCLPQWREEWRDMADKPKVLPTENTVYYVAGESGVPHAVRGELDSFFCYDSLEAAEAAARDYMVNMTVLEVRIKPVSITRKVTEVERL